MLRARTLKLIAGTAVAALALSACGSNTSSTTTPSTSASAAVSSSASSAESSSGSSSDTAGSSAPSSDTAGSSAPPSDTTGSSAPSSDTAGSSAASTAGFTGDPSKVKIGLAYDLGGRGDQSFNDAAAAGLDKAKKAGVGVAGELEATAGEPDSAKVDRLNQLIDSGATDVVAVGFAYAGALATVAAASPKVNFAIIDDSSLSDPTRKGGPLKNVASLTFAEEQGSYLVGAAAALQSKAGHIGFIGGVNTPLIQKFQAGYDAGAKATKADIKIDDKYITEPPDFAGFNAPDKGNTIAKGMYDGGADIIYAAAGGSGAGVFKAAKAAAKLGIGVDSDQYKAPTLADVKSVIITSMIKKVDVAVYDFIASAVDGKVLTGQHVYDLKAGGIDFSTSGGAIDAIKSKLDGLKADIISGKIKVPSTLG